MNEQSTTVTSHVEAYASLDLAPKGQIASELEACLPVESRQFSNRELEKLSISLSPREAASVENPPMLTSGMLAWYTTRIASPRVAAINEARGLFEQVLQPDQTRGFLFEVERDRIEKLKLQNIVNEREVFFSGKEVRDTRERKTAYSEAYAEIKVRQGRDAQRNEPVVYWSALVLVALLEAAINFNAVLEIPAFNGNQFFATSLTILIAICFTFSSHFVGEITKQWRERFGGNVSRGDKATSIRHLNIAGILFVIGFAAVIWSRYYFFADALKRKAVRGDLVDWTDIAIFFGAALGNLMVYFIGVAWAFWKHDTVPHFAELRRNMETEQARYAAMVKSQLDDRKKVHIQQADKEQKQLIQREDAQRRQAAVYKKNRDVFERVHRKDIQVIGLLNAYRNALVAAAKQSHPDVHFVFDDVLAGEPEELTSLTPDQYQRVTLALPRA